MGEVSERKEWIDLTEQDIIDIVVKAELCHPQLIPPYTLWLFKQVANKLKEKNGYH